MTAEQTHPMVPMKHLAEIVLGKMLQNEPKSPDDVRMPYARAASVGQNGRLVEEDAREMWFAPSEIRSLDLRERDILVVEGGDVGRSILLADDQPGWGFQNSINRVRASNGSDPRFLNYALIAAKASGYITAYCDVVSIPHLTAEKLKRLPLPAPDGTAQILVADYLDAETNKIDTLIAEQIRLVELLRERRATVVDRLVWRGLNPDAELAATGIDPAPLAPKHWLRRRNKNIFAEATNLSEDGSEELLTVSHLTGITPRSEKTVNMFKAESLVGYRIVQPGDLVINTMWAWMGALGVSSIGGVVSPAYGVYRPQDGVDFDPRYFDYLYRSRPYVVEMTRHSRGIWSSRLRLYPEVFLRLNIVIPPLAEQQQVVAHLDEQTAKIDTLIAEAEKFVELAKERRSALITAAVTGQIDSPRAA